MALAGGKVTGTDTGARMPLFARTVYVGAPCPPARRVPLAAVAHAPFAALLDRFADAAGRVAYAAWKADAAALAELHAYLAALGRADPDEPGAARAARVAFWLNAYNALTLAGVLRVYPTPTVRAHTSRAFGFNMWKHLRLHVAGRTVSLSEIEHGALAALNEPRAHFALVCAANGCPALAAFLARPDAVRYDPARNAVVLSRLFKWYRTDLGATPAEQLELVRKYLGELPGASDGAPPRVEYEAYDWGLNDRPAPD
jgi:hypothetical protein